MAGEQRRRGHRERVRRRSGKRGAARRVLREAEARRRSWGIRHPRRRRGHALRRLEPAVRVVSRRRGGQQLQRPRAPRPGRRRSRALRLLLSAAAQRKGVTAGERLAREVRAVRLGRGQARQGLRQLHRTALASRSNRRR